MSPGSGGAQTSAGGAETLSAQIFMQLQQNQAEIARETRQVLQTLSESFKAGVGKPSELGKDLMTKLQRHGRAGATSSRRGFAVNGQQANRPWIMKGDEPVSADDLLNQPAGGHRRGRLTPPRSSCITHTRYGLRCGLQFEKEART